MRLGWKERADVITNPRRSKAKLSATNDGWFNPIFKRE